MTPNGFFRHFPSSTFNVNIFNKTTYFHGIRNAQSIQTTTKKTENICSTNF